MTQVTTTESYSVPTPLPAWVPDFLDHYRRTGLLASCARAVGTTTRKVNQLIKENVEFSEAFKEAHELAIDELESEARRRGLDGVDKGVYYKGKRVDTEKQYSDSLLRDLLKADRAKFQDKVQHLGAGGAPLEITIKAFTEGGKKAMEQSNEPLDVTPQIDGEDLV